MASSHAITTAGMTPADLAELMRAFNEVTAKLEASHSQLKEQVARLTRELHDANEQVERSRRLAALGEMAAGIAHEVRNPLGGIRLYARMLEQDLAGTDQARTAAKITGAARVVEGIVDDVLSFAREFRLRKDGVRAGDLFDRVLEACSQEIVSCGARVDRSGDDVAIDCDGALMHQALVNIVANAAQAIAAAGGADRAVRLSAAAGPAAVRGDERVAAATITVRDTGAGVTPEVEARMFNPFFTTRPHGTGLGLAIVHRIVDAHGGRVSVRNNEPPMRGACVEIVVPSGRTPPDDGPNQSTRARGRIRRAQSHTAEETKAEATA
ncbi:MAG TPA: ATP-binding protein [Phycisphaerales bacterium]|nr:ATP-binding protein [Phycisphaerales bacterium]